MPPAAPQVTGSLSSVNGSLKLVISGDFNRIDIAALDRLQFDSVSATLALSRKGAELTDPYTCVSGTPYMSRTWNEFSDERPAFTVDAVQPVCTQWFVPPEPAAPGDCEGTFGAWSACSAECAGGTRTRPYVITNPGDDDGEPCEYSEGHLEEEDCNTDVCTVNCEGNWQPWSECSTECGAGEQSRQFVVTVEASEAGRACHTAHEGVSTRQCNVNRPCAVDCVGDWVYPAECPLDCAEWVQVDDSWALQHGEHSQTFVVSVAAAHGGAQCDAAPGDVGSARVCTDTQVNLFGLHRQSGSGFVSVLIRGVCS